MELPENPTREILHIIACLDIDLEELFRIGKAEQQRLGCSVVFPKYEIEKAAAIYRLLYNHLADQEVERIAKDRLADKPTEFISHKEMAKRYIDK